jgi:hypothetical protein
MADGYRLAFGEAQPVAAGRIRPSMASGDERIRELLSVAIAYYEDTLDPAPPELEATQADLARLVRWIAEATTGTEPMARFLSEAVDAIDDGLPADAIVAWLARALATRDDRAGEQADAADLLAARYRALVGP